MSYNKQQTIWAAPPKWLLFQFPAQRINAYDLKQPSATI